MSGGSLPAPEARLCTSCRQLDYYFRIDTDTRFDAPHREDFFDLMARGNHSYAFVRAAHENGQWTEGL